jgi:hypothetical protein
MVAIEKEKILALPIKSNFSDQLLDMILFGFSNSTSPIAAFKPSAFTLMS